MFSGDMLFNVFMALGSLCAMQRYGFHYMTLHYLILGKFIPEKDSTILKSILLAAWFLFCSVMCSSYIKSTEEIDLLIFNMMLLAMFSGAVSGSKAIKAEHQKRIDQNGGSDNA